MWQWGKNQYHFLTSFFANLWYRFPGRELTVIGVTGTSGKTTTAHMIYEILKKAGYNVSLLSSIQAIIGDKELDTGFHVTTPDPHTLPQYLRRAVKCGSTHFVLEVSSHGLDQNRAAFIPFKVGVLTSLAHEHLDYHKTFLNYAKAKFKLLQSSKHIVIPHSLLEDKKISSLLKSLNKHVSTFGLIIGSQTQEKWKFHLQMPGDYNIMNALAAASVGNALKVPETIITSALEQFKGVPGRFEEIETKKPFRVVIDFAHKPDALEAVLKTAQSQIKDTGRIIVIFGSAGSRDVQKRAMMGEISGRLAEITIITDEDPRFEDPQSIVDQIAKGCEKAGAKEIQNSEFKVQNWKTNVFFKIPGERAKAIEFAIQKIAQKGDIVICCGKGHEKSMNYKGKELPWSEHEAVRKALKK